MNWNAAVKSNVLSHRRDWFAAVNQLQLSLYIHGLQVGCEEAKCTKRSMARQAFAFSKITRTCIGCLTYYRSPED